MNLISHFLRLLIELNEYMYWLIAIQETEKYLLGTFKETRVENKNLC